MTKWWSKPDLHRDADDEEERKVGFLDLFYDLIFVVAVAQLAHDLAHHPDLEHAGKFILAFAAVWWLWIGNTFYTDRFETQDASHRVFTFMQMMPVVGLAVFAHGAFADTSLQFAVAYCVGRLLLVVLWWRGGRHNADARKLTDRYVTGFTLGLLPWIASFFVEGDLKFWLWGLGLLVDFVVPATAGKLVAQLPAFSHSRLAERFGLFTIIVLGETVAGTVNGLTNLESVSAYAQLVALLAMLLAFQLWWLYFDMVPRERIKPAFAATMGRSFLHLPLLAGLAGSGAGVLAIVGHEAHALDAGARWLLTGSVAVSLLAMVGLSRVHDYHPMFQQARFRTESSLAAGATACLLVGAMGTSLGAVQLLVAVVVVTMIPIVWGVWHWAKVADQMES